MLLDSYFCLEIFLRNGSNYQHLTERVWECCQTCSSVLITPEKFENTALFICTIRPTVHTDLSRIWSFSRNALQTDVLENTGISFSSSISKMALHSKRWRLDKILWFLWPSFPRRQIQHCCVFKFFRRSVKGKHNYKGFSELTSIFKFLRRSVDGK